MEPQSMDLCITVFAHDYYILELPAPSHLQFYQQFPVYKAKLNFQNAPISYAPVIRLFGTSLEGQKSCVHVHGYFPFIYIKTEQISHAFRNQQFRREFLKILEGMFKIAYKKTRSVIYRGEIEQKFDFYGYHTTRSQFLKIYLYDPLDVPKMRELLSSKAINNKFFQTYEAHVSYYMHFFADLHIFGFHKVNMFNISFRRNVTIINQFKKIASTTQRGITVGGIDLGELSRTKPGLFNMLDKVSSCYLELDVSYDCIVNYLYSLMSTTTDVSRNSIASELADEVEENGSSRKFKVLITKALNQFWFDEKMRRQNLIGTDEEIQVYYDYSKNIQSKQEVIAGQKDPISSNFLGRGDTYQMLFKYAQSFKNAKHASQVGVINANMAAIESFEENRQEYMSSIVERVKKRWEFYGKRTKNLIDQIIRGVRNELPEWDTVSEESGDEEAELEEQEDEGGANNNSESSSKSVFDRMKQASNVTNNMAIFRRNFKVNKGEIKKTGFFSMCGFCKQMRSSCRCSLRSELKLDSQIEELFRLKQVLQSTGCVRMLYNSQPPSFADVEGSTFTENQFGFFSNFKDLYRHHNVPGKMAQSLKMSQILDRELKPSEHMDYVVSIHNSLKLPSFWRVGLSHEAIDQTFRAGYYKFSYSPQPPLLIQAAPTQKQDQTQDHRSVLDRSENKKAGVFSSDVSEITFELMTQCQTHYSNPDLDPICAIVFSISNQLESHRCRSRGIIIVKSRNTLEFLEQIRNSKDSLESIDDIIEVKTELNLLMTFSLLCFKIDPDLLISYDHERKGIYYLILRASKYSLNYSQMLSRVADELDSYYDTITFTEFEFVKSKFLSKGILTGSQNLLPSNDNSANSKRQRGLESILNKMEHKKNKKPLLRKNYHFHIEVKGRVTLNVSRVCQFELKCKSYTIEAINKFLFNRQIPEFTDAALYEIYRRDPQYVLKYKLSRVDVIKDIINKTNMVGAVIEKCKLYGCDFNSMV